MLNTVKHNNWRLPLFIIIISSLFLWFSYLTFSYKLMIIHVDNQGGGYVVTKVNAQGAAAHLGLTPGDIVLQIDGKEPQHHPIVQRWGQIEQAKVLKIMKDGDIKEVYVDLAKIPFEITNILNFFVAILAFGVTACLYFIASNKKSSIQLMFTFFNVAMLMMSVGASSRHNMVGEMIVSTCFMLLPICFAHYFILYFKEKGEFRFSTYWIKACYMIISLSALGSTTGYLFKSAAFFKLYTLYLGLFFVTGVMMNLYILIYAAVKHRGDRQVTGIIKRIIWTLLLSLFPYIVLSFIPRISLNKYIVDPQFTGMFILILPLSFVYLIFSRQLYELVWLRKSIFAIQEKENERIASDLHDTVMQDVYFVKQKLNRLLTDDHVAAQEQIEEVIEHLELVNVSLRETCFNLFPKSLEDIPFQAAIQKLTDTEIMRAPYQVHLDVEEQSDLDKLPIDTKYQLFRMIQELLNNARKHSKAEHVYLHFKNVRDYFYFEYIDNGKGFQRSKIEQLIVSKRVGSSGLGLIQLKNRIQNLGGNLELFTQAGQGLRVKVSIPI